MQQMIEKLLALIGWAFVIALATIVAIINIIPILGLLLYCLATRKTPREVVELVLSH